MLHRLGSRDAPAGTVALWGAAGLIVLLALVEFLATFATHRPWTLSAEMLISAFWWVIWLALVPVVGIMARRFSFTEGRRWESVVAHLAAATLLSMAHLAAVATIEWRFGSAGYPHDAWMAMFARFLGVPFLVFDMATYGGLAAALIATSLARASRDSELVAERLRARATALEASVVQTRLDALRMQLNPHFLFNSLNAVSGLVGSGRAADAQEMLGRLGGLLRETLKAEQSNFNTVAAELTLLDDFLFIEQIRFGDRLTVSVSVDGSTSEVFIPTMLLQPLVENAVRHGIEHTLQRGTVSVDVRRSNGNLVVRIEDTGPGFPLIDGRLSREGIGLSNTRARLQQLFGADASLSISNRAEGGARVDMSMPWVRHPPGDGADER